MDPPSLILPPAPPRLPDAPAPNQQVTHTATDASSVFDMVVEVTISFNDIANKTVCSYNKIGKQIIGTKINSLRPYNIYPFYGTQLQNK